MRRVTIIWTVLALSLSAGSFTTTQKVRVSHSKPIYKTIEKKVPYTKCWTEEVPRRHYSYRSSHNDNPIGTIIGGVAGGILGNQVGKGRGKTVATIGGALIGSMVGHNLSNQEYRVDDSYYTTSTEKRCTTKYKTKYVEEFIGYKNIAYINGNKIVKITPHKKRYIRVTKTYHY